MGRKAPQKDLHPGVLVNPIGISIGDATGVGPEVTLKALAAEAPLDSTCYHLLGDAALLHRQNRQWQVNLPLVSAAEARAGDRFVVMPSPAEPLPEGLPTGDPRAAHAAVAWVRAGAEACQRGELSALVTAPVNKESIIRAGIPFVGQTELLSEMARTSRTAMMLLGHDDRGRWLRVILATTHVSIRNLPDQLTREKVTLAIELAADACRRLRLPRQRIALCGLNPHAGEGGNLGTEEQTIIGPAAEAARARGIDVVGPASADALFHYVFRGDCDAVVAMYHDQGLAPLKMVAFEHGINWTLGLPFIRTSPDHGTAYDIAGQGKANPSSMIAALRLAKTLAGSS